MMKVGFSSAIILSATLPNAAMFGISCHRAQGRDARVIEGFYDRIPPAQSHEFDGSTCIWQPFFEKAASSHIRGAEMCSEIWTDMMRTIENWELLLLWKTPWELGDIQPSHQ